MTSPFLAAPDGSPLPFQFAWDSVSFNSALSCWRQYQLRHLEGWRPRGPSTAIALTFGILFHSGLEAYHRAKAEGLSHDDATFVALQSLIIGEGEHSLSLLPVQDDVAELSANHDEDEDDGIFLRNSKVRTRYHLFRALVWYLEHYASDPVSTLILDNGKPAVELSFRMPLPDDISIFNHPVLLTGHFDRVGEYDNSLYIQDYKTTKSLSGQFFSAFSLAHQISGYTLAGGTVLKQPIAGVIIDGIALQMGGCKFSRAPIPRSRGQLEEYLANVSWIITQAEALGHRLMADPSYLYPMNTSSCYFCEFKQVCQQPPEYRRRYLSMSFDKVDPWNPLANR